MKKYKKIVSIFLCVSIVLACLVYFTACSAEDSCEHDWKIDIERNTDGNDNTFVCEHNKLDGTLSESSCGGKAYYKCSKCGKSKTKKYTGHYVYKSSLDNSAHTYTCAGCGVKITSYVNYFEAPQYYPYARVLTTTVEPLKALSEIKTATVIDDLPVLEVYEQTFHGLGSSFRGSIYLPALTEKIGNSAFGYILSTKIIIHLPDTIKTLGSSIIKKIGVGDDYGNGTIIIYYDGTLAQWEALIQNYPSALRGTNYQISSTSTYYKDKYVKCSDGYYKIPKEMYATS